MAFHPFASQWLFEAASARRWIATATPAQLAWLLQVCRLMRQVMMMLHQVHYLQGCKERIKSIHKLKEHVKRP
jgi:hypothetical protein